MMAQFDTQRFAGSQRLYGQGLVQRLASLHVMVVGIGGVGSWVVEALARTAVGKISLMDMDDLCISNTNRQLPAMLGQYGRPKVEAMRERALSINPSLEVQPIFDFLSPENIDRYLQPKPDYVIDCIDSIKTKTALVAYCRRHKIPLVCTGGAGGKTDPTRIRVCDLADSIQDPLAAKLRSKLRKEHGFAKQGKKMGVDLVTSDQAIIYPQTDGSVCTTKPQTTSVVRLDCAQGFGASMMVTASFAMAAVSQMITRLQTR